MKQKEVIFKVELQPAFKSVRNYSGERMLKIDMFHV